MQPLPLEMPIRQLAIPQSVEGLHYRIRRIQDLLIKKEDTKWTLPIINIMHILRWVKYWASKAKSCGEKKKTNTKPKNIKHASRDLHKVDFQDGKIYIT